MSFPRYPEYKDSGVEWLGEVPGHWSLTKIGTISSLKGRLGWQGLKADEYRDEGPYVVSSAHFDNRQIQWSECPRVSQERYNTDSNIQLAMDDVLLMKDGAAMGKLAFVGFLPGEACLNSHLLLFRPITIEGTRTYDPKFLFYFMQTGYFQEHIKVNGTGATFLGISQYAIGRYQIAIPPLPEQTQIAAFLDRETAKIDALVAEQRRLMALLKEKRQAVISHAVTRGLNPHAPMKSSGIEWLGDVPEHWDAPYFGVLIDTADLGGNYESSESGDGIPLIKMGNLDRGFIKTNKVEFLPAEIEYNTAFILNHGDFLFNTRNSLDLVGKVAIWRDEIPVAIYNSNILRISFKKQKVGPSEYMSYFFNSDLGLSQLRLVAKGTTSVAAIYYKDLTTIRVVLPPIIVQHSIVDYLDDACAKLDTLTTEAQRAIDLLQERRTALISAAVTGQIDVRQT